MTPVLAQVDGPVGHRHETYRQSSVLSIEKDAVRAEIRLAPSADAFPMVMADIDTDGDGDISPVEQRGYAEQVLRDVWIAVDGQRVLPHFVSMRFPSVAELKAGTGRMEFQLRAELPGGGGNRTLTFDNRHESRIGVYEADILPSTDANIRLAGARRNGPQSSLEIDYQQTDKDSRTPSAALFPGTWTGTFAGLLLGCVAIVKRQRVDCK